MARFHKSRLADEDFRHSEFFETKAQQWTVWTAAEWWCQHGRAPERANEPHHGRSFACVQRRWRRIACDRMLWFDHHAHLAGREKNRIDEADTAPSRGHDFWRRHESMRVRRYQSIQSKSHHRVCGVAEKRDRD